MIVRAAALALLVAAGVGYAGFAIPARRDVASVQDQYAQARDERQGWRARLAELERRRRGRAGASSAVAGTPARPSATQGKAQGEEPAASLRRAVLAVVDGAHVSGVQLSVSAGRSPVGAKVRLTAEGRFADLVPLSGRLTSGPPGLVLERVHLVPRGGRLVADVEAFRLEDAP
jgi:hypothetical protein